MSAAISSLRRQLRGRGGQAPPDVVGPITILRELEAICGSVMSGHDAPHAKNRASLVADTAAALDALGPNTSAVVTHLIPHFKSELFALEKEFDFDGAVHAVGLATRSVLAAIRTEQAVAAAWQDVVDTFQNPDSKSELCEQRIMQLVELAEHRGVDYQAWSERAAYVLGDDPRIMASIGEVEWEDLPDEATHAGVSQERRIELCAKELNRLPERTEVAVWLALADAPFPGDCLDLGPIQIFKRSAWPEKITSGQAQTANGEAVDAPPEFENAASKKTLSEAIEHLADTHECVFARVWFAESTATEARERAEVVVRGALDLHSVETTWRLLNGWLAWTPEGWSGLAFRDPETDVHGRTSALLKDRTQLGLQEIGPVFLRRWLDGEAAAAAGADDALWVTTLRRTQSVGHRVILAVRAIEHSLGHLPDGRDPSWVKAASRYMRSVMIHDTLLNDQQDALLCAFNAIERLPGRDEALYGRLRTMVVPPDPENYLMAELAADLVATLPDVVSALPAGTIQDRIIREALTVLTDKNAALDRLAILEKRFDAMLARTSRQRNALVHGTGTTESVLRNVDPFAVRLAEYTVTERLRSVQAGNDHLAVFERDRVIYLRQKAQIKNGAVPAAVLWDHVVEDLASPGSLGGTD
jgi:hypothetical protein